MLTQIELSALADYMLFEVECDPALEDDCFAVSWEGHRLFVQRRRSHFNIEFTEIGETVQLPRC